MIDTEILTIANSFTESLKDLLPNRIIDVILYGSAARGGFVREQSDIDFIVFVNGKLTSQDMNSLRDYHHSTRCSDTMFKYLEGRYIALDNDTFINVFYVGTTESKWRELDIVGFDSLEQAIILDSYKEILNSGITARFFSFSWQNVFNLILVRTQEYLNNDLLGKDIGFASYAILASIRSLYTIRQIGFASKKQALEWIIPQGRYMKYNDVFQSLLLNFDHISNHTSSPINNIQENHMKDLLQLIYDDMLMTIKSNSTSYIESD